MLYQISEIAQMLNPEQCIINIEDAPVTELLTDSRSLTYPQSSLFFALHTKNNDGHRYIYDLYTRGVRNFVVETLDDIPLDEMRANFLIVSDSLAALQSLATSHRRRFNIPVIGITGSRGKTTVKEWLYQLLRDDFDIVRSPRSYNSQIGVPLSLWDIDDNTSLAIIEAGISMTGEMKSLQAMIRPEIGVFTNLGSEHREGFYSAEEMAREKAQLFTNCDAIVYCADERLVADAVAPMLEVAQDTAWSRTNDSCAVAVSAVEKHSHHSIIHATINGEPVALNVPFTSDIEIQNAICCAAVMTELNISNATIAERMARLTPVDTRLSVVYGVNNCLIVADSYTSDYNSLGPAINFMQRRATDKQMTVILSDVMRESYREDDLYERISSLLNATDIRRVIGIGKEMCAHAMEFSVDFQCFESTKDFLDKTSQGDFENEIILVKGAPEFEFSQIIDRLEAKQHQTVLEVNLDNVARNFNFFRSRLHADTKIVCMVKAFGYGAGSYEIAKTLQDIGAGYLAVAVHDEGVELRKAGITMPIMVLNPFVLNYKAMFSYNLEPEVFSIAECKEIIREAEKYGITNYPVHIKLDSGMHRLGFVKEQLPELIALLNSQKAIYPKSAFSHLAAADEDQHDGYTAAQFAYFYECCTILDEGIKGEPILRHILNTTGAVRFTEHQHDMVRLGIGLYGIKTVHDGSEDALRPVSSLRSVIISINEWPEGTTIGYGRNGVLTRPSRIATIPIGYADGMDRHFGNGATSMWINDHLCPTVGNICMDLCMVDVTDVPCQVGDAVEIFGEHIPVEALAEARGTIPYEVLTSISERVKRVYFRE